MDQLQVHWPGRIVCLNRGLHTVSFDVASKPALRGGGSRGQQAGVEVTPAINPLPLVPDPQCTDLPAEPSIPLQLWGVPCCGRQWK